VTHVWLEPVCQHPLHDVFCFGRLPRCRQGRDEGRAGDHVGADATRAHLLKQRHGAHPVAAGGAGADHGGVGVAWDRESKTLVLGGVARKKVLLGVVAA
jgi:hypothetical protein